MALRRVVRPLHCAHARVSAAASHHSTLCGMRAGCRTRCDVMSACRNALRATTEMRQVCARQLQGCVMPSARSQSHPGFPKGADTRSNRSHTISKRSPWDLAASRNAKFGSHLHCSDRGTGAVRPVVWQRGLSPSTIDKSINDAHGCVRRCRSSCDTLTRPSPPAALLPLVVPSKHRPKSARLRSPGVAVVPNGCCVETKHAHFLQFLRLQAP